MNSHLSTLPNLVPAAETAQAVGTTSFPQTSGAGRSPQVTDDRWMSAVRLYTREGRTAVEQIPVPTPGPNEVLVKVAYAGACLTDVHFVRGETAPGMPDVVTLGHEVAGIVEAIGSAVGDIPAGSRVVVNPLGRLHGKSHVLGVHYDGGWAEYVLVPAEALIPIGPTLSFKEAAIVPDAVATAWSALTTTGQVKPSEAVAVWGVGGLGFNAIKLLRLLGACPIIAVDPLEAARGRALSAGADAAFAPDSPDLAKYVDENTKAGLDVAFDFFGSPNIHQQAFDLLTSHGRLVLTGIPDSNFQLKNTAALIRGSKRVIGHYGATKSDIEEILRLVHFRRLDISDSVSTVLPMSEFSLALDALESKEGNHVRIVLQP